MGMFNDILENAKAVAIKFGEKANDVYDITKLRAVKSRISVEIDKDYKKLGNKFYILHKEGKLSNADFSSELIALDELHSELAAIEMQILDTKNNKRCPVCGNAQDSDKPFCADCGAKF